MLLFSTGKSDEIPRNTEEKRKSLHLIRGTNNFFEVILLVVLLFPSSIQPQFNPFVCPEETHDGVFWPETHAEPGVPLPVSSKPLCLSENRGLITRSCVFRGQSYFAQWEPRLPPICSHRQSTYDDVDKCPPPFRNLTSGPICAHVGLPGSWEKAINTCFLSGTSKSIIDLDGISLDAVIEYIRQNLTSQGAINIDDKYDWRTKTSARLVWLDGRRNKALTPIVRKLPGDFQRMGVRWKELSNASVAWATGEPYPSSEKQCLAMEVPLKGPPLLRMAHCFSRYPAACVFVPPTVKFPLLTRLSCPEGYVTSLYQGEQHRCFRIIKSDGQDGKTGAVLSPAARCRASGDILMRISSAHVNALFVEMAKAVGMEDGDRCLIGLFRKENGFFWRGTEGDEDEELDYVNWLEGADFEFGEVGAALKDGRWDLISYIRTPSIKYVACERPAQIPPRARMTLRLHPPSRRLLLSIYSGEGLWRYGGSEPVACFSDGQFGFARRIDLGPPIRDGRWSRYKIRGLTPAVHSSLNFKELHKTVFVLPTTPGEVARYWCEARRVKGFRALFTEKVWNTNVEKGTFVFSLAMEAIGACTGELGVRDCEPTFGSRYYEVAVDLRQRMRLDQGSIKPIRILSVTNGNLCLLMHVTIKTQLLGDNNTSESSLEHATFVSLMQRVSETVKNSMGKYDFLWLRSTRGCIQSYTRTKLHSGLSELNWDACPLGYSAVSKEICLQAPNGNIPVIRTCRGDYMFGGIWDTPSGVCSYESPPKLTENLHSLMIEAKTGMDASATVRRAAELSSNPSILSSADIHFLAMMMRGVAAFANTLTADRDLGIVTSVVDHVMRAKHENVALSQRLLNSTNVLLDAIDEIFGKMMLGSKEGNWRSSWDDHIIGGVYTAVTSKVAVQVSDISTGNNVTGVALVRKSATSEYSVGRKSTSDDSDDEISGFKRYSLLPLTSEQTLDSLFDLQPEVAVFLPLEMLPGGEYYFIGDENTSESTRVVTTLFYNDLPFRRAEGGSIISFDSDEDEEDEDEDEDDDDDDDDEVYGELVNSRVINIATPGLGPDLPAPVPILFRPLKSVEGNGNRQCAHWDFSASSWGGGWASDGCFFAGTISSGMDVCICTHLTHFAELLLPRQQNQANDASLAASQMLLDIISIVGCVLSLIGVAGIVATAIAFRMWRVRLGSKVLLHLTIAIGLEMILFLLVNVSNFTPEDYGWCLALGCFLHYSVIATFCWMLVAAGLQYLRFVRVFGNGRPNRFLLKASIFGWGFPLIPVILIFSIDASPYGVDLGSRNSSTLNSGDPSLCYPMGLSLSLGVVFPVTLVVTANIIVYVLILKSIFASSVVFRNSVSQNRNVSYIPNGSPAAIADVKAAANACDVERDERRLAVRHLRLAFLLFFLLGLSWIFGIIAKISGITVFSYLFCATATLQGFILFVFYVVADPNTRDLWAARMAKFFEPIKSNLGRFLPSKFCLKFNQPSARDDPKTLSSAADISFSRSSRSSSLSS